MLAVDRPDRVRSLVLISTSPALPDDRELPPPTDEFGRFVSTAQVDWSDADSVIDYLVGYQRVLAGGERPFDEAATREPRPSRRRARARLRGRAEPRPAPARRADRDAPLSSIAVPTLVIHGTADPMFPLAHGEALADEIPGRESAAARGSRPRRLSSRLGGPGRRDRRAHRRLRRGLPGRRPAAERERGADLDLRLTRRARAGDCVRVHSHWCGAVGGSSGHRQAVFGFGEPSREVKTTSRRSLIGSWAGVACVWSIGDFFLLIESTLIIVLDWSEKCRTIKQR